jgi:hypothetical protein
MRRLPDAADVTREGFGGGWRVLPGTLSEKPNRCLITDGSDELLMIWGPPTNFSALLWAAMNAVIDHRPHPVIIVTSRHQHRLGDHEKRRHHELGGRAGIEVRHVTLPERIGNCGNCADA